MKKPLGCIFFLCLITIGIANEASQKEIEKTIDIQALHHPYLIFSETEKTAMLQRVKTDRECRDIMKALLAEGNRLIHQPVDFNIPIQGKNTRAHWSEADRDNKYEQYFSSNLDNAVSLAFLYQMTGEKKYADKAYEFADAFCDLTTWTLRPHEFPIIYSRIMPWNVPDDQVCFTFDHNNGDAGRDMAFVYDWLYPALAQRQRDRIRGALIEKVITRVRGNYEFHWWATAYRCNWCGVCNTGVGMAGLALLKEHPQLVDVVAESYNRIDHMLDELDADGGWQEGGGYWSYALRTSAQFAKALQRASKGKYDLFKNQKLAANPANFPLYIFIPPRRSVNFEDSGGGLMGPTFLLNLLAAETGDARATWYRQNVLGEGRDWRDIVWPRPQQAVQPPEQKSKHFRNIDFWVMRSDFKDPNKVIVAGKAGKNDDPHHGHLDIGQVVVFWKGHGFISEIGRAFYDEKYFDEARWDYPSASSSGHNLIFVNGEEQIPGKHYKQPYNYEIGGKVLTFQSTPECDYVLMDPTNAYPQKELKGWRRHVILDKPNNITLILDEVKSAKGAEIDARFHSEAKFETVKSFLLLKGDGGWDMGRSRESRYIRTTDDQLTNDNSTMALIPIINAPFSIHEDRHASLPVNASYELEWIPYFGILTEAVAEKTVLASLILPVENKQQAQQIAATAHLADGADRKVVVTFLVDNKPHEFIFRGEQEGLLFRL